MTDNQKTSSQKETREQKSLSKINLRQIIPLALNLAASLITLHHPQIGCNEVKWDVKVRGIEIERTVKSCPLPSNQTDPTAIYH